MTYYLIPSRQSRLLYHLTDNSLYSKPIIKTGVRMETINDRVHVFPAKTTEIIKYRSTLCGIPQHGHSFVEIDKPEEQICKNCRKVKNGRISD